MCPSWTDNGTETELTLGLVSLNPPHPVSKCSQFICVYSLWSEISLACLAGDSPPAVQSGGHLFSVGATANKVFSLSVLDKHRKLIVCHGLGKVCLGTLIATSTISFFPISYSNFGKISRTELPRSKWGSNESQINTPHWEKNNIMKSINQNLQWLCSHSNVFWHELRSLK